ncbi:hypothetical protein [Corallococcus sp. EGB]|uniref:hypothetical protein n=1 Tax=Corallococcus sp. EGB TaxID=1521117 RepID=UPI001CC062C3|nr:hypothetical protein [Corallococcus sp. EGB]
MTAIVLDSTNSQQYVESRVAALGRADLEVSVGRGSHGLEVRFGPRRSVRGLSYSPTVEQVDALMAELAAVPVYVEPKPAPARSSRGDYSKARRYDRLFNEGGEGYNPYR